MIDKKNLRKLYSAKFKGNAVIWDNYPQDVLDLLDYIDELESAESRNEYLNGLKAKIIAREDHIKVLEDKLKVAEEALIYYADEDGGPYAPGDWHTVDGGQRAMKALAVIRGGNGE